MDLADVKDIDLPFSCVIPLHEHCILLFKSFFEVTSHDPISVTVPRGMFATFRGGIIHAGGRNDLPVSQIRIHIYFACKESEIPDNSVYDLEEGV